jgi:hypothetical protein
VADSVTFRFSGGEQFAVDLRHWRDRLRAEVHESARHEAFMIESVVRNEYHLGRTGNLKKDVRAKDESAGDAVLFRVRSLAPHSHLFEKGTRRRQTARGWNRGVMPAHPIFIPEAILRRSEFKKQVQRVMGSPEPALGTGTPTVTGSL